MRPSEEVVLIPAINGRPVISRADMAARGVPRTTVDGWYRHRARTGHPEKAGRIGRTDYWYEDEWTAWHEGYLRGKVESLTQVDRSGDPDDLVDAAEAARMLRYASRDVIHANRRLGYFPEPDAYGTTSKGRRAPLWKRSTVWTAADNREGPERRPQARHPWRPRQAAPVRGRRTARIRPVRAPFRHPALGSGTGRAVEHQPADCRADHPCGAWSSPGLIARTAPARGGDRLISAPMN